MTAAEWLDQRFGTDDTFSPMSSYTASRQFFLDVFGPTFEAAYNAGKRGQELHDALLQTSGGTRGWELYFADWLRRGLFDD
ncbi:MAG TPA: hypothetical protein VF226_04835 [Hyphomicrobiaceae bacterium]